MTHSLLSFILFAPFVGAAVLFFTRSRTVVRGIAIAASGASMGTSPQEWTEAAGDGSISHATMRPV